jgi:hypothetical protein
VEYLATTNQLAGLFPFTQAAGLPATGVPVGHDLLTGQLVCLDPAGWVGTLTTNPGIWVEAGPGVGKSALAKRLATGLSGLGHRIVVPADPKGEYTALVRHLGGQVIRVGRGADRINPLDSGPLGRALPQLPAERAARLRTEVDARRTELLLGLLAGPHGLGRRPDAPARYAVTAALALATQTGGADPVVGDLVRILRDLPAPLLVALRADTPAAGWAITSEVAFGLANLCGGPLAGILDGPTTTPLDVHAPAVAVDLSALLTAGEHTVAAGMLAGWALTYGALDVAAALGITDTPTVLVLDELWRGLRAGPGMVDTFDSLTRLNRAKGTVTIMITHSLRDLDALPSEADRAKAAGLMERTDTVILGACSPTELAAVSARRPLTTAETALVASWADPTGTGLDTAGSCHPGRGRYLIKIGHRLGVPTRMNLTATEALLYDTDRAIRARPQSAGPR